MSDVVKRYDLEVEQATYCLGCPARLVETDYPDEQSVVMASDYDALNTKLAALQEAVRAAEPMIEEFRNEIENNGLTYEYAVKIGGFIVTYDAARAKVDEVEGMT